MQSDARSDVMDIARFVAEEHEHFTKSATLDFAEFAGGREIQKIYADVLSQKLAVVEDDMPVLQLFIFTHYYFLYSMAALMRWHLSEAFGGVRIALDGALVAAQLIHERRSHVPYTMRTKPFDQYARYLGNLMKDGKPLPHPLVPTLIKLHKKISMFTSHADVGTFIHRTVINRDNPNTQLVFQYFQCSDDARERRLHALSLLHAFVIVIDVFSDFLVTELRLVPDTWRVELHRLGGTFERRHSALKAQLESI